MESQGTSWADQWDSNPDPVVVDGRKSSNSNKYKQKVGEGLGKTKSVAKTGITKLKEGTSVGLNWIKTKYNKTTHK
ncbi:putative UVI1 [Senna tora]|uniref:Putative UVI1 n=1 Tax=Senna tora TaxID=362788 RepID=A0A834W1S7_9FABA|nr:putative UVI1 [Senna tora]